MKYVLSYLVEYDNTVRLRAFRSEKVARRYVERLATRLVELADAGRSQMFVSLATVYRIQPSGALRVLGVFNGHDRGDGVWHGWEDE